MIRRICGSSSCVAMGIKELSGAFNLAELQGKRLCIDSEMDAAALNSRDIAMLKKVVGNDLLQGNRKYEQPFYFQCQTKVLLCTNNKIRLQSDEDMVSFFNRMKFFELKDFIPREEQCLDMDEILDGNRTYFLQEAMRGLCRLVSNHFEFSYFSPPEDFIEYTGQIQDMRSVDEFVAMCCELGEDYMETNADLYQAYQNHLLDNRPVNSKKFSSYLVENYGVFRGRTGKNRFLSGIRLVTHDK